jgi:hypothetical protein
MPKPKRSLETLVSAIKQTMEDAANEDGSEFFMAMWGLMLMLVMWFTAMDAWWA